MKGDTLHQAAEKHATEYRELAARTEAFCAEVPRQLNRLLQDAGITLGFPIEYRVKAWASIAEKIERKELRLASLTELRDLIGVRIVLLFRRDVTPACEILRRNFEVVDEYNTQERLREDQFGYSSMHFIVKLTQSWLAIPTFSHLGALQAEIQVRTVAQHIWAAASHKLQYKQEHNVPVPVRRAISRVSALLETVDLELERVLHEREEYRATLASASIESITRDESTRLDVDLLQRLLSAELPQENKDVNENYGELLQDLFRAGVQTSRHLQDLVAKHRDEVMEEERQSAASEMETLQSEGLMPGMDEERVMRGVFFTHVGLARCLLQAEGLWPLPKDASAEPSVS